MTKKKIVFISSLDRCGDDSLNLGILSLATVLNKSDYSVDIIDLNSLYKLGVLNVDFKFEESIGTISDYISNLNPSVICLYTMCNSFHNSVILAEKLKSENNYLKILLGGPHATLCASEILTAFNFIDGIGIGEGENTILDIVDCLIYDKTKSNINGFAYIDENSNVKINENINIIQCLDDLPYIDYNLVDIENYNIIPIDVGRGCPFGCKYCSTKTFWKRQFRVKSPERIISEVKYLKNKFNKNNFDFVHDLFTANKSKFIDFCNLLKKSNLGVNWTCSARLDTLDENVIKCMSESGCKGIFLGIETGSKHMQIRTNKNLNIDNIWDNLNLIKKYKLPVVISFIYGFPDETEDDLSDTLTLIMNLVRQGFRLCQLHFFTVLPGTEYYEDLKHKLYYSGKISDFTESLNSKKCESLIKDNPLVFPQFFDFENDIREKYRLLDRFITQIYLGLYNTYKGTMGLLEKYYMNNLKYLYLDFINYYPNFYDELYMTEEYLLNNVSKDLLFKSKTSMFYEFINKHDFGEFNEVLKSIAKFEFDYLNFIYNKNSECQIKSYKCDVLRLKQGEELDNKRNSIHIYFKKMENGKVRIHNIDKDNKCVNKLHDSCQYCD